MNGTKYNESSLKLDLTAKGISDYADETIKLSKKLLDDIVIVKPTERTFLNTIKALDIAYGIIKPMVSSCTFPCNAHPDKKVRDASVAAMQKFSKHFAAEEMRHDVYDAFLAYKKYAENDDISKQRLSPADKQLITRLDQSFKRRGLHLGDADRIKLVKLREEMSKISNEYEQNLNELTTTLLFTKAQLKGLPTSFLNGRAMKDGKYVVGLKYPDYFPVMSYASDYKTRKRMFIAFHNRCVPENVKLLIKLLKLRHEEAQLLGYANHSEYILDYCIAKRPENVDTFLKVLAESLAVSTMEHQNWMRTYKKTLEPDEEEAVSDIKDYDVSYYSKKVVEELHGINSNEIRSYFELPDVINGILETYQELLGLRFKLTTRDSSHWHSDVTKYDVYDVITDRRIGSFYFDLYSRKGKFGHYAEFDLLSGYHNGQRRILPTVCILGNFTPPGTSGKDKGRTYLTFSEVSTFFHEFGHVMHEVCTESPHAILSGSSVESDFVEAPSQMLENWCYERRVISRLSGGKMPDDLIERIIKSKNAGSSYSYLPRVYLAMFDLDLHTMNKNQLDNLTVESIGELWLKYLGEVGSVKVTPGTNFAGSFAHIAAEYSSRYYGYMWSRVFSSGMYEVFKTSKSIRTDGRRYRDIILASGGTKTALEMFSEFTGRDLNINTLIEDMGGKPIEKLNLDEIRNTGIDSVISFSQ